MSPDRDDVIVLNEVNLMTTAARETRQPDIGGRFRFGLRTLLCVIVPGLALVTVLTLRVSQAREQLEVLRVLRDNGCEITSNHDGTWLPTYLDTSHLSRVVAVNSVGVDSADVVLIAKLPNLRALNLSCCTGDVMEIVGDLDKLEQLDLSFTDASDVCVVSLSHRLQVLSLGCTHVSDITPLAAMSCLRVLDIAGTDVTDIAPLARLKNIEVLDLFGTDIDDLTALATLVNLRDLDIQCTDVTSVAPLSQLRQLEYLDAGATRVEDLPTLGQLPKLHVRIGGELGPKFIPIAAALRSRETHRRPQILNERMTDEGDSRVDDGAAAPENGGDQTSRMGPPGER